MYSKVKILLVDDSEPERNLFLEAFKKISRITGVNTAKDGDEALNILHRVGRFKESPLPNLIVLDLNMPKRNGYEVLQALKTDPSLKKIPVIMFTSSASENDIDRCYSGHANCYVVKPAGLEEYVTTLKTVLDCWCQMARLPSR